MSIPLKYRKVIKESVAAFDEKLKEASTLAGVTLIFVDTTAEMYAAMAAVGADEPDKFKYLVDYGDLVVTAFKEICADDVGREGLAGYLNKVGGQVKFVMRDPSVSLVDYWVIDSTGLGLEIRSDALGAWTGYYTAEGLGNKIPMSFQGADLPLSQRKKLKELDGEIQASMKAASAAFGAEITWDPNYGKLWTWLVENGDPYASNDGWKWMATGVRDYVAFFSETFIEFISNPDNKEAIQEKMTAKKFGFRYLPKDHPDYVAWAWQDGVLQMDVVGNAFGYWLTTSYYSLEKT